MYHDEDVALALKLQEQFDRESRTEDHSKVFSPYKNKENKENRNIHGSGSLVDPSWEYVDPTPDIHVLFIQFDKRFFWNKLKHVEVRWSPRMTSCAGICCYEGRGGLCSIRLSVPLLKLRPRKDLVETLLHEMIHAYLFVTCNNRDRDGHGPEFHKHMYRINKEAGTNISVYHDFIEEVKLYQQHWWRCDGPCQKKPPFFGMVKRSMNRAPGPSDFWYDLHQRTCGGNFIKVREPEGFGNKKNAKKNGSNKDQSKTGDIRNFFPFPGAGHSLTNTTKISNSTKDVKPPKSTNLTDVSQKSNTNKSKGHGTGSPGKNNGNSSNKKFTAGARGFTGGMVMNKGGGTLTITAKGNKNKQTGQIMPESHVGSSTLSNVRTITDAHHQDEPSSAIPSRSGFPNVKTINGPVSKMPSRTFVPFGGQGYTLGTAGTNKERAGGILGGERVMKNNTLDNGSSLVPKANKRVSAVDPTAVSCSDSKRSALVTDPSGEVFEIKNNISDAFPTVNCPVCNMQLKEYELNVHLDTCLSLSSEDAALNVDVICIEDSPVKQKCGQDTVNCPACNLTTSKEDLSIHLENCLGNVFVEETEIPAKESADELELVDLTESDDQKFPCPSCCALIKGKEMNNHLDLCLSGAF